MSIVSLTPKVLLEARDLRVSVRKRGAQVEIVRDASLHVAAGEIVGILGESGSGKSTLCRALAGVLPRGVTISAGSVQMGPVDLLALSARERRRRIRAGEGVGFVFQEPLAALNPVMSIGDQIIESVRVHDGGGSRELQLQAVDLLTRVGIPDPQRRLRSYPHQFSGGQRQRIMLAMVLASNPRVLIADEPTSALDVTTQVQILDLIEGIVRERSLGMIVVSHDFGVLKRICERVAVMYAGLIVEEAATPELLQAPRHPYTLALLEAIPSMTARTDRLLTIPGRPLAAGAAIAGCPFRPRCRFAQPECEAGGRTLQVVRNEHRTACVRTGEIWSNG